jgi:hypothetical protein
MKAELGPVIVVAMMGVVVVGLGWGPAAVRVCEVEVSDDEEVLAVPAIGHQNALVRKKANKCYCGCVYSRPRGMRWANS